MVVFQGSRPRPPSKFLAVLRSTTVLQVFHPLTPLSGGNVFDYKHMGDFRSLFCVEYEPPHFFLSLSPTFPNMCLCVFCFASGPLEAAFSILALRDGFIPHTLNLDVEDPEFGFTFVKDRPVGGWVGGCIFFCAIDTCVAPLFIW